MVVKLDVKKSDSEQANERYAPSTGGDTANQLNHLEHESMAGYDRDNDGIDALDPDNNINKAKKKEEDPGEWKNSFVNSKGNREKVTMKNFFKKKGPASLILGLLLGGGGVLSVFSPGLLIIDLKEKMMEAFSDELAVMDTRSTAMLKKKFKGAVSGVCSQKITIRCKFNTLSNKQLKTMEAAGIKVNKSGDTLFGRNKIDSLEYLDSTGKMRKITAVNFSTALRTNPDFQGAMLRSYSLRVASGADSRFMKLAQRTGINKLKNITGDNDKEREKSVLDSANGEKVAQAEAKVSATEESCTGDADGCVDGSKTVYKDDITDEVLTKEQYEDRLGATDSLASELKARKALTQTGEAVTKATLKGALTVTALGLGAVDSACTGYTLVRVVSFAAKYLGALQLMRFAYSILNTADSDLALEGDVGANEFVGNFITATNSEGKSGTDSYGFKYAAYGDAPPMERSDDIKAESVGEGGNNVALSQEEQDRILVNDETTKYVSGQLVGNAVLAGFIKLIDGANAGAKVVDLDKICKFVKSGWGQTILISGAIVGAVVAFFSGGLSLGWGTAAQVGASVVISVAMAMLTPKLIDMAAGTYIGKPELTNGNRAINAMTSGMGHFNHEKSSNRGVPVLKKKDAPAYAKLTQDVIARYKAVDRATHSPLDATNPNTFLGSFVSSLLPYTTKMSSVGSGISSLTKFTTSSFASLIPRANAADPNAQYEICQDPEYKELELATDPFCNLKHGMSSNTLAMDSDTVVDYMVNNNYIDEVTGEPTDPENEYAQYLKNCTERAVSIGGYTEDNSNTGEECIQGTAGGAEETKRNMFRLFYIDMSIDDGMENGMPNSGGESTAKANGVVKSPVTADPTITSKYGPRGSVGGADNASTWHAGIDIVAQPTDVVAAMAGEVIEDGGDATNTVVIRHADGLKTLYLHMYPGDVLVKKGATVTAGQKIGKIGCAGEAQGFCNGPHLHFNIWIDGVKDKAKYSKYKSAPTISGGSAGKAINPANFLTDNGVAGYKEAVNGN